MPLKSLNLCEKMIDYENALPLLHNALQLLLSPGTGIEKNILLITHAWTMIQNLRAQYGFESQEEYIGFHCRFQNHQSTFL